MNNNQIEYRWNMQGVFKKCGDWSYIYQDRNEQWMKHELYFYQLKYPLPERSKLINNLTIIRFSINMEHFFLSNQFINGLIKSVITMSYKYFLSLAECNTG